MSGAREVAINAVEGKVIMKFSAPSDYAAYEPGDAVNVGKALIDCAVSCGLDVKIQAPRVKVPAEIRERMKHRAVMMLRNKREAPESDNVLAIRMVDTLLNMLDL